MGIRKSKRIVPNVTAPAGSSTLPLFCDYTCPHADFAPEDATGACRREQAVYCTLVKKFNKKNADCIGKKICHTRDKLRRHE